MHIHLPKPLHGWRALVGEIGIIVIGVLIALGAEQVVEFVHMRSQITEARQSLRDELANDSGRWEVTHEQYPCLVKRLDELQGWAKSARPGAALPHVRGPFLWNAHVSTWEMARSSAAVASMALAERDALASVYQGLEFQQEQATMRAARAWSDVIALAQVADEPQNRAELRLAIVKARQSTEQLETGYNYIQPRLAALNIEPDFSDLHLRGQSGSITYVSATNCPSATGAS